MKKLLNGCSRTDVYISPKNYRNLKSKKDLDKDWFVECRFYDPTHESKYPNGFQFRKKVNRYKTIGERKIAAEILKEEMETLLDVRHYNPLPCNKFYMVNNSNELTPQMSLKDAFEKVQLKISGSKTYLSEIKFCVNRLLPYFERFSYDHIPISTVKIWHIKNVLNEANLTPHVFKKYRAYLMRIFKELIQYGCIEHNPCREIAVEKIIPKRRKIFDEKKLKIVVDYIEENYPDFFQYLNIFFVSGARTAELFRVQAKHVNLAKQEYEVLIMKGRNYIWVNKIITDIALPFWEKQLSMCKSPEDFLFSKRLKPGVVPIDPSQMTKRWYRLIKCSDKIKDENGNIIKVTEDFYPFKHLFLDKISEYQQKQHIENNLAKTMANHKEDRITNIYTVNKEYRENEILKKIPISLENILN